MAAVRCVAGPGALEETVRQSLPRLLQARWPASHDVRFELDLVTRVPLLPDHALEVLLPSPPCVKVHRRQVRRASKPAHGARSVLTQVLDHAFCTVRRCVVHLESPAALEPVLRGS